ncbi:hypothetical protein ACM26V_17305 [Salipaludibacillus sp. HK11]|uniref:tubby C-terminal domain-like protein n=1 Tax=Salipaludibacillus sp. HK11 TaxID=3394320 RepID=UPI0039FDD61F
MASYHFVYEVPSETLSKKKIPVLDSEGNVVFSLQRYVRNVKDWVSIWRSEKLVMNVGVKNKENDTFLLTDTAGRVMYMLKKIMGKVNDWVVGWKKEKTTVNIAMKDNSNNLIMYIENIWLSRDEFTIYDPAREVTEPIVATTEMVKNTRKLSFTANGETYEIKTYIKNVHEVFFYKGDELIASMDCNPKETIKRNYIYIYQQKLDDKMFVCLLHVFDRAFGNTYD